MLNELFNYTQLMIIKIISFLSILILLTTNTYAHSVNWSAGSIIFLYALAYGPFIILSLLIAFFLPKLFKNKPKGILSSLLIRTILSALILWLCWVAYFSVSRMIYRSGLATITDIKELSIPIKEAYISFCKENNRFPSKRNEIDNILNPMGFIRKDPQFSKTGYSNENTRFNIEGSINRNHRYTFHYRLKVSSELANNYHLNFDNNCNYIGDKGQESYKSETW